MHSAGTARTARSWRVLSIVLACVTVHTSNAQIAFSRSAVCANDAIFATNLTSTVNSSQEAHSRITNEFRFAMFDIVVDGRTLARDYRGHSATISTFEEQACISEGFAEELEDVVFLRVSGTWDAARTSYVYDCNGCPEDGQVIDDDTGDIITGAFGDNAFLWRRDDGPLAQNLDLGLYKAHPLSGRDENKLYLSEIFAGNVGPFLIEYMPVCTNFNEWIYHNMPAGAVGSCETLRTENEVPYVAKGETCSLSCDDDHVVTSGPPEYNKGVSELYTCAHNADPEWHGTAECTPLCQHFLDWVDSPNNNFENTNSSDLQCMDREHGATCSIPCNQGFNADGANVILFTCNPESAPEWSLSSNSNACEAIPCTSFENVVEGNDQHVTCLGSGHDQVCELQCAEGYELPDGTLSGTFSCDVRGSNPPAWFHTDDIRPACQPSDCSPLSDSIIVPHASTDCLNVSHGAYCGVTCDAGFQFADESSTSFVCEIGPQWEETNQAPECVEKKCNAFHFAIEVIQNSTTDCGRVDHNALCQVECKDGYRISGATEYVCSPTEEGGPSWKPANPGDGETTCTQICEKFTTWLDSNTIPNGGSTCSNTALGDTCSVSCDEGYTFTSLPGTETYTCHADNAPNWTPSPNGPPTCGSGTCNMTMRSGTECVDMAAAERGSYIVATVSGVRSVGACCARCDAKDECKAFSFVETLGDSPVPSQDIGGACVLLSSEEFATTSVSGSTCSTAQQTPNGGGGAIADSDNPVDSGDANLTVALVLSAISCTTLVACFLLFRRMRRTTPKAGATHTRIEVQELGTIPMSRSAQREPPMQRQPFTSVTSHEPPMQPFTSVTSHEKQRGYFCDGCGLLVRGAHKCPLSPAPELRSDDFDREHEQHLQAAAEDTAHGSMHTHVSYEGPDLSTEPALYVPHITGDTKVSYEDEPLPVFGETTLVEEAQLANVSYNEAASDADVVRH